MSSQQRNGVPNFALTTKSSKYEDKSRSTCNSDKRNRY